MGTKETIVLTLDLLMLIPTLASLTRLDQWWIRGFDFPRLQISLLKIVLILVSLWIFDLSNTLETLSLGALILSLGYQVKKIFPYTPLARKQVLSYKGTDPEGKISVLVCNVLMHNRQYHRFKELVSLRQPDLFLTLETDKPWEQALEELELTYRYSVKVPLDNLYGMHLYSRIPLEEPEVRYLVQQDIPSIHTKLVLNQKVRIHLHCLHPKPPSPMENATSTNRDAELLMVGRDIKAEQSVLVIGDLNDVAWSRTTKLFQGMSGLLDPRIGRGFYNTFHADHRVFRWPLDHVFHSNDFTLVELAREKHIGSDHFPMFIRLHYQPPARQVQEEPKANGEEKAWAEEKITEAEPLEKEV